MTFSTLQFVMLLTQFSMLSKCRFDTQPSFPAVSFPTPFDSIACKRPSVHSVVSVIEWYLQYILKT